MISKIVLFLLPLHFVVQFTHAQNVNFRKDYYYSSETDSYYKFHTLPKTLSEARIVCEREGATLVYPESETESQVIHDYWINTQPTLDELILNKTKSDIFTPEGILRSGVYALWHEGEPNNANGEEECIVLHIDCTINDVNCNNRYPFICMKRNETIRWNDKCRTPYPGYIFNNDLDKCYKYHSTPKNWFDAYATCNAEESYLAVADNDEEVAHFVKLISKSRTNDPWKSTSTGAIHLGFFDKDGWSTTKGVPLHLSGYQKWCPSQPDGGISEDCGAMAFDGLLHDIACSQKLKFICEKQVHRYIV